MLARSGFRCTGLVLGPLLLITPLAQADPILVCNAFWGELQIGAVQNNPFTADLVHTDWQILPDGTKVQDSHSLVFNIARNNAGRVSISTPVEWNSLKSTETEAEPTHWDITICDPGNHTTTHFEVAKPGMEQNRRVDVHQGGSTPGLNLAPKSVFTQPAMSPSSRLTDLGHQDFDGISAHGFRLSLTEKDVPVEGEFTDQWISEALASEVSHVRVTRKGKVETRATLTHIRRIEPDPALFQIPADLQNEKPAPPH